jgi:hypothetical protein
VGTPERDMAGPGSYILFAENSGEFASGCLTGVIHGRCEGDAVEFTWDGNDESEPASGHGWPRYWTMALSKVISASKVATIFPLSRVDRPLLQQPARAFSSEVDTGSREENASKQNIEPSF